jgi:hypothetical protein
MRAHQMPFTLSSRYRQELAHGGAPVHVDKRFHHLIEATIDAGMAANVQTSPLANALDCSEQYTTHTGPKQPVMQLEDSSDWHGIPFAQRSSQTQSRPTVCPVLG